MWRRTKGLLPSCDHATIPALDEDCLSSLNLCVLGTKPRASRVLGQHCQLSRVLSPVLLIQCRVLNRA